MADDKKNPLIGAFRAPAASPALPPKPAEPSKAVESKSAPPTPASATVGKEPEETPEAAAPKPAAIPAMGKAVAAPKAAGSGKPPAMADEPAEKTPSKPITAAPKPAAQQKDAESVKPADGKNPSNAPTAAVDKPPTAPSKPQSPETVKPDTKKSAEVIAFPKSDKPIEPKKPDKEPDAKTTQKDSAADSKASPEKDTEIPADFTLPIAKSGHAELITTLKVSEIHPFEGHPFNVKDDKDMEDLADSIKKFGVLEPVVVIPRSKGGYEMVSGHRRHHACQLAGVETMPVIVRQLTRDEAIINMVDANLKRENITPMEKARAYAMKLEAMKRTAGRLSKEAILGGAKPMRADEQLAQETGDSRATIQRLTRLTKLEPELQKMVDDKKIPVNTAAEISYLKKDEQKTLADAIKREGGKVPSGTDATKLKEASKAGVLTTATIAKSVAPTKREETPVLKVTFSDEELRGYFPDKRATVADVKRGVFEALDLRKRALERQAAKEKDSNVKPAPVR